MHHAEPQILLRRRRTGALAEGGKADIDGRSRRKRSATTPARAAWRRRRRARCASRILVSFASMGRKMSCPVALLAVSMPTTRPRRSANQRVATVAPRTSATMPVPRPTTTPQSARAARSRSSRSRRGCRRDHQLATDHRPHAEPVDEGGGERPISPNSARRTASGGDLGRAPAEFPLERHDHHARRAHRPGRRQHGEEGGGDDDPPVVDGRASANAAASRPDKCGRAGKQPPRPCLFLIFRL